MLGFLGLSLLATKSEWVWLTVR